MDSLRTYPRTHLLRKLQCSLLSLCGVHGSATDSRALKEKKKEEYHGGVVGV